METMIVLLLTSVKSTYVTSMKADFIIGVLENCSTDFQHALIMIDDPAGPNYSRPMDGLNRDK